MLSVISSFSQKHAAIISEPLIGVNHQNVLKVKVFKNVCQLQGPSGSHKNGDVAQTEFEFDI